MQVKNTYIPFPDTSFAAFDEKNHSLIETASAQTQKRNFEEKYPFLTAQRARCFHYSANEAIGPGFEYHKKLAAGDDSRICIKFGDATP
jgi:hypothetical protein